MPTRAEFAASIKSKYPAYKDVPDDQLVDAMLAKYPTYKSRVTEDSASSVSEASVRESHQQANPLGIAGATVPTDELGQPVGDPAPGRLTNFYRNTIRNPISQAAAQPKSAGDLLNLMVPDVGAVGTAVKQIPGRSMMRWVGQGLQDYDITKPTKPIGDFLKWLGKERPAAIAPEVDRFMPNLPASERGVFAPSASHIQHPESAIDRYAPNVSGVSPGYGEGAHAFEPSLDRYMENLSASHTGEFAPSASHIQPSESVVDRFMPNSSGAHAGYGESSTPLVTSEGLKDLPLSQQMEHTPDITGPGTMRTGEPLIPAAPRRPAMDLGRLTGGKAPTLEETLLQALTDAAGGESPSLVSSHPSTLETAGEGGLKQSGKFGKSGSMGQAGGYSSGRPSISDTHYDEMLNKVGGKTKTAYHDITGPEWHSGETPGSPQARSAQTLHEAEGSMSSDFKRKMEDPLASLLISLLGGGSAGALMSSHGDHQ